MYKKKPEAPPISHTGMGATSGGGKPGDKPKPQNRKPHNARVAEKTPKDRARHPITGRYVKAGEHA